MKFPGCLGTYQQICIKVGYILILLVLKCERKWFSFSCFSRLIDLARDISNVREQDYFTLLAMISNNRVGEPIVWDFYRNEWEYLVERFTLHDRLLGRVWDNYWHY